jgi:uncharacterized membrane protein YkvA (DUF1232 family)
MGQESDNGSTGGARGRAGQAAGEAARRLTELWERLPPDVREPLTRLVERLPSYLRVAWGLARDPRLTHRQKLGVYAGGLYNLSPIDAVPGIIPILGQLDDYAALLLGIRKTLRACEPDIRREHLDRHGLSEELLDRDIADIRRVAGIIAGGVARAAWGGIRESGKAWYEMGRSAARRLGGNREETGE